MNIIFFGSSQFAVLSLKSLLSTRHNIVSVVTPLDKKKGRGLQLSATAVKTFAEYNGLQVIQPADINAEETIASLKGLCPDLFVIVAYGKILSPGILKVPQLFSINVHASLLPRYRGAAPVNWAVINGESVTGVTIIRVEEKMDAGPMLAQREIKIREEDTAATLSERLAQVGSELLLDVLLEIENKKCTLTPQNERKVSLAPKLKKEDGLIDWQGQAVKIHNQVRGCLPWPGAYTHYQGKLLKIYFTRVSRQSRFKIKLFARNIPGQIKDISDAGITVATGGDDLIIEELQLEGSRLMRSKEFVAGHKIKVGDCLK